MDKNEKDNKNENDYHGDSFASIAFNGILWLFIIGLSIAAIVSQS